MAGLTEMLDRLRGEKLNLLRQLNESKPVTASLLRERLAEIDAIIAAIEAVVDDR